MTRVFCCQKFKTITVFLSFSLVHCGTSDDFINKDIKNNSIISTNNIKELPLPENVLYYSFLDNLKNAQLMVSASSIKDQLKTLSTKNPKRYDLPVVDLFLYLKGIYTEKVKNACKHITIDPDWHYNEYCTLKDAYIMPFYTFRNWILDQTVVLNNDGASNRMQFKDMLSNYIKLIIKTHPCVKDHALQYFADKLKHISLYKWQIDAPNKLIFDGFLSDALPNELIFYRNLTPISSKNSTKCYIPEQNRCIMTLTLAKGEGVFMGRDFFHYISGTAWYTPLDENDNVGMPEIINKELVSLFSIGAPELYPAIPGNTIKIPLKDNTCCKINPFQYPLYIENNKIKDYFKLVTTASFSMQNPNNQNLEEIDYDSNEVVYSKGILQ